MYLSTRVVVLLLCGAVATFVAAGGFRARPGTGTFRHVADAIDGSYLFHGVNIVHKATTLGPVTAAELHKMKRLGFNVVRFGFLWFDVEPFPGQYNETYLDAVQQHIDFIWQHGLYVFLDLHQDCFSPYFCAGADSVPAVYGHPPNETAFYVNGSKSFPLPFVAPKYLEPMPPAFLPYGATTCELPLWSMCYTTWALSAAVQRFYDNTHGARDAFARMWRHVAARFRGHPAVIGYEIMNEPWLGQVPLSIEELIPELNPRFYNLWNPGVADRKNLQSFYDAIAASIRSVDNETAIFFEPASGGSIIDPHVGFAHGPGGPSFDKEGMNVLSYHVYCPLIESDVPLPNNKSSIWHRLWDALTLDVCKAISDTQFVDRSEDIRRLQVGGFLSEFGAIPESHAGAASMVNTLNAVDALAHSWTFWAVHDLLVAPPFVLTAMTRSYPQRVPGQLLSFRSFEVNVSVASSSSAGRSSGGSSTTHARHTFQVEYELPSVLHRDPSSEVQTQHGGPITLPTGVDSGDTIVFLSPVWFGELATVSFEALPPCCVHLERCNATSKLCVVRHNFSQLVPEMVVRISFSTDLP